MNLISLLGVAFIVLKLCGIINWSWWWVLSPFLFDFIVVAVWVAIRVWAGLRRDRRARLEAERKPIARERREGMQI
jgi:small Trp-rich protein